MKNDLIVFGEDWNALPSSTQHIIRHLNKSRKVLWVNSIGLRQPKLCLSDIKRATFKLFNQSHKRQPNLPDSKKFILVNPRTLPAPQTRLGRAAARLALKRQLLPLIKSVNLHAPILWTSLPTAVDLAGHLGESALVYYCGDDFSSLAGVDHSTVTKREAELANKADLILAASPSLASKFPEETTKLQNHGVDFTLFSTPCPRAHDLPASETPTAGFYGSISEWLDIDLLHSVIQQLPQWQFVFIGHSVIDTQILEALPNTQFLGERAHSQLPSYAQHWSASLLPFKDNAQIRACNPLKLREYLAAGRPIVSTSFPALKPYKEYIVEANTADSMIRALKQAHASPTNQQQQQQQAVSEETWSAKSKQLSTWLDAL